LSKYFSKAKENMNKEKIEIKIDGINVNSEKNAIYFLFVILPLTFMSFFNEFRISLKVTRKKNSNKTIFAIKRFCRFSCVNLIKLLSIKVKKVKKPIDNVVTKIRIINKYFFIKLIICLKII
tara:strand:- start:199 stop:564 length:366 start_codon:yes stop_codon:yes gene_type:complete